jgi:hypothetical protein
MEPILEKWWEIFNDSSLEDQIILQTWIYGLFCYIQDSQEAEEWVPIPFEELFEYANEFNDLSKEGADELKESLVNLRLRPLVTTDEFQKNFNTFVTQTDSIEADVLIIKELLTGEDLCEETRTRVLNLLKATPTPQKESKKKQLTRRVHGRRSITPIKRKNGRRATTSKIRTK